MNIKWPAFERTLSHSLLQDVLPDAHHTRVTLDANADTLLSLTVQVLGLDTQAANLVFAGPTTGAAAVPTFRSLVVADIPTGISHGSLANLLVNDHTQYVNAGGNGILLTGQSLGLGDLTAEWQQHGSSGIHTAGQLAAGGTPGTSANIYSLDIDGTLFVARIAGISNTQTAGLLFTHHSASLPTTIGAGISLGRSRGTRDAPTIVSSGDLLGSLKIYGHDGVHYQAAAAIQTFVDTTPGANDMPTRMAFYTTPDGAKAWVERMRINNAGRVSIGGAADANAFAVLDLVGTGLGLLVPRMTTANAPVAATDGLIWYDSTTGKFRAREGGADVDLRSASAPTNALLDGSAHSDTLAGSVVLGDLIHGNVTPKWARLAGNTAATKKFLTQTGTGVVSAVPAWDTIAAGDLPTNALLDGSAHSDTVAQAVSRGSLIYGNSTPKWDELVIGAANKVLHSDGTDASWQSLVAADLPANSQIRSITFIIDGGGSAITTGVKGDLEIPFGCTINRATLLADQSGSIVIDIWKDTYANYPPTVADTITASAKPTLSAAAKSQDSTLTGWTTSITAGDTLRFNVDSVATVTRVTLSLKVTVT